MRRRTSVAVALFSLTLALALACGRGASAPPSPRPPTAPPRSGNGLSVLLITIDTLRADHLGLYGYRRPTSPHIDALGQRGTVFDRAFTRYSGTALALPSIWEGGLVIHALDQPAFDRELQIIVVRFIDEEIGVEGAELRIHDRKCSQTPAQNRLLQDQQQLRRGRCHRSTRCP